MSKIRGENENFPVNTKIRRGLSEIRGENEKFTVKMKISR
ncbi:hypothetical protein SAMN05444380_1277 [Thermophagus xiamenensis]|uniref:Uncharacterized protein n=1 Tax=Thermophagus xiamenensis TaxID=385682 RepID=A0A1I2F834_9BACT|nr:hypothetical protein SAMN05444380_1277 [Thermophagus xiamenensis]